MLCQCTSLKLKGFGCQHSCSHLSIFVLSETGVLVVWLQDIYYSLFASKIYIVLIVRMDHFGKEGFSIRDCALIVKLRIKIWLVLKIKLLKVCIKISSFLANCKYKRNLCSTLSRLPPIGMQLATKLCGHVNIGYLLCSRKCH